jgi:hypothetical protein
LHILTSSLQIVSLSLGHQKVKRWNIFTQKVEDRIYFHLKGKKMEYFFTQTVKDRIYLHLKEEIFYLQSSKYNS